jgi:N-acetylmuramoyl-L-alanine amidase domain protein
MAKIAKFFFTILALILSLYASDERILKFDQTFDKADAKIKRELFSDLKSLYVKAIINDDKDVKKEILQRLIKGAKALELDGSAYEAELKSSESKSVQKPTVTAKTGQKPAFPGPLRINALIKNKDNLELKLNKEIRKEDIKFSKLNIGGVYRNIYDISGILGGSASTIQGFLTEEIRISQFNKTTVRVVFASKKPINLDLFTGDKILSFALPKQKTQQDEGDIVISPKEKSVEKDPKKAVKKHSKAGSKIVVLDAGHGGNDAGAVGNGNIYEKNVVLAIALKAGEELKSRGYKVFYTRSTDKFINLRDRTSMANDKLADLFVSIHANAAPNAAKAKTMHGIETFFLSPARSERSKNAAALENKSDIEEMNYFSQQTFLNFLNREKIIASNKLAIDVQREVLASAKHINSNVSDGGVREAPFWVLVGALMPAVLLEVGYITHPSEGVFINDPKYQYAIAKGLADGIDVYFSNRQ